MKKKVRTVLFLALSVVLVVSLAVLFLKQRDYRKGESDYSEAQQEAKLKLPAESTAEQTENDPFAEALKNTDFAALQQTNPDVCGWLLIPDTELSYPLVQGENNDYYLTHTWKKEYNTVGAVFLDCRVSEDFTDFNTIIYGHRMRNGSMFATLKYYVDQEYFEAHPCIYLALPDGVYCCKIFAAYEAGADSATYQRDFPDDEEKSAFIQSALDHSVITCDVTPTAKDRIITLSTCTGQGYSTRWVVQAVLEEE